jgi:hypothetical protein
VLRDHPTVQWRAGLKMSRAMSICAFSGSRGSIGAVSENARRPSGSGSHLRDHRNVRNVCRGPRNWFYLPDGERQPAASVERAAAQPAPDSRQHRPGESRVPLLPALPRHASAEAGNTVTDRYAKLCEDVAFRKAQAERVSTGFNLEVVPRCPPHFDEGQPPQTMVM